MSDGVRGRKQSHAVPPWAAGRWMVRMVSELGKAGLDLLVREPGTEVKENEKDQ